MESFTGKQLYLMIVRLNQNISDLKKKIASFSVNSDEEMKSLNVFYKELDADFAQRELLLNYRFVNVNDLPDKVRFESLKANGGRK